MCLPLRNDCVFRILHNPSKVMPNKYEKMGRKWVLAIGLAALLLGGLLLWQSAHAPSTRGLLIGTDSLPYNGVQTPLASTSSTDQSLLKLPTRQPARSSVPLPALDLPFSTTYPILKERADAGDPWAQCHLAVELIHCREATEMLADASEMKKLTRTDFSEIKDPASRAFFERVATTRLRAVTSTAEQCADVPTEAFADAQRYLREAGRAGLDDATLMYLQGLGFDRRNFADVLRNPEFDAWYREAGRTINERARRGDPRSVWILLFAYEGLDETPLDSLLGDDDASGRLYQELARLLTGKPPRPAPTTLSPERLRAINAEAQNIFQNAYGGKRIGSEELMKLSTSTQPPLDKTNYGCQSEAAR